MGRTEGEEVARIVVICLDHSLNFFDTADINSAGNSERVLGEALKGKRDRALISSKATFKSGDVVDALDAIAKARGKTITQVELNWVLGRPSITTVVVGARDEEQLLQNLGALGRNLTAMRWRRWIGESVSRETPVYPYWHQVAFSEESEADGVVRW